VGSAERALHHELCAFSAPREGEHKVHASQITVFGKNTHDSFFNKRLSTKYDVSGASECIRVLVEHGARWNPEGKAELNSVRKALYQCEPVVVADLMKLLARNKACPEETLEQLLDAPRMREHLSSLGMRLIGTSPKRTTGRQ
jgi:hypothetical protein